MIRSSSAGENKQTSETSEVVQVFKQSCTVKEFRVCYIISKQQQTLKVAVALG